MASLAKTTSDIKSLKIQGAQAVAESALRAWADAKDKKQASRILKGARPTEPMLFNALAAVENGADPHKLIEKFHRDREKIAKLGAGLIKNNSVVYTHCHSSTVVGVLRAARAQGKSFVVYSTETRPLFQGRITSSELAKAGIAVHHLVDSAGWQAIKKASTMLIGADWISQNGVANKIGTESFAELAAIKKIPVYCCSHSWKFSPQHLIIEERPDSEVWPGAPKNIKVHNPAFEIAEGRHITGVVCELGILNFNNFIKMVKWMSH